MSAQRRGESGLIDQIEEVLIAVGLGLMTLITFANVIARYVFQTNLLWALEATVFLFAWMVLLGTAYVMKKNAHLGVDVVISMLGAGGRKVLGLIAVLCCIIYAALLLKGGWDYWANFANLPQTTGKWFPTGIESDYLSKGWYEVNDIAMPDWLQWVGQVMNEGDRYEKIPRFIPYAILPLSMALLLLRCVQAAIAIWRGVQDRLIASHEVEEMVDDIASNIDENART